jgi:hypothetical protein
MTRTAAAATEPGRARARNRAGLAAGALAGALALCSCSGSGSGVSVAANPVAAVRSAGSASMKIDSAQVATSVTLTTDGKSDQFSGTGAFSFARQVGSITLTVPPDVSSHGTLDEVITPSTLYMRPGGSTGKWVQVDADKLADGDLISAGYTSPILAFALLGGAGAAGDSVHYVGQDKVYNVAVAHYSGTLDLDSAASSAPAPVNAALTAASHSFSSRSVPFDVYLDAQGQVLRFVAHFQIPATAPQKGTVSIVSSTDLYSLDKPVTVATPDPSDVVRTN